MLISIVTPAYKAERYLAETLSGVLGQTYRNWEHVVVDDGSPDDTAKVVERFAAQDARFRLHRQANAGVSAARNAGYLQISPQAQYVIFLDADDVWRPGCLQLLAEALRAHPDAPAAHGRAECIGDRGQALAHTGHESLGRQFIRGAPRFPRSSDLGSLSDDQPTTFAALALRNPISTPGQTLIRRTAFERIGSFDSDARPAEDWDLWLQLARGAHLAFVPETVLDYRRHAGNASAQLSRIRRADLYVRYKTLAWTRDNASLNDAASVSLRYVEMQRSRERMRLALGEVRSLQFRAAALDAVRSTQSAALFARSFLGLDGASILGAKHE